MSTQQQTIPAGFTERDWHAYNEGVDMAGGGYAEEQTWGVHDGPRAGGVAASWAASRGFMLEVDGYGQRGEELAGDLTPTQARQLVRDLSSVIQALDALESPEVERVAHELHARGKRVTLSDLGRMCEEAGVSAPAVATAYLALMERSKTARA